MEKKERFVKAKKIYENKYKKLLLIPIIFFLLSISILGFAKISTGEFIGKDVGLTGGITVTIQTTSQLNVDNIKEGLEDELNTEVRVRELTSISTGGIIGYTFELKEVSDEDEIIDAISKVTGLDLDSAKYSVETTSAALGSSFFQNAMKAVVIAFIAMMIVVFIYFRKLVVSGAIILSIIFDVIGTLAVMNIIGIKLSTAGVAALLMVIGYSVDTDILLSTKLIKRKFGSVTHRLYNAMNTGLTMQFTTLVVFIVMYLLSPAYALKEIAIILIISIIIDIVSTWIQNAGIIRLYLEKKHHG
ncbi:MAG: protein translocase subunit SecF [Candidatus Woesearchaeota archaeon]|nr:MAG: protein translocase subunit SecF [Candidatus Woesearchaeota archaeon]